MTLPRTIQRREKRKRAKALIAQRAAEWAALSPEERKRRETWKETFDIASRLMAQEMLRTFADIRLVSGSVWDRKY